MLLKQRPDLPSEHGRGHDLDGVAHGTASPSRCCCLSGSDLIPAHAVGARSCDPTGTDNPRALLAGRRKDGQEFALEMSLSSLLLENEISR